MSMWQLTNGALSDFKHRGFKSWPNPFSGMVRDIDVLACQDTWQAKVELYGGALGNWFWSNFVPSPVEITRKTISGSYKCGFFLHSGFGSPLDVVWKGQGVGRVVLETTSPLTKALFYIWAAETLFSGLDTVQSIIYAMEKCGLDHDECLLKNGVGEYFAGGATDGTPGFYTILQDRRSLYAFPGGAIDVFHPGWLRLNAFGHAIANGTNVSQCIISFQKGTEPMPGQSASVDLGGFGGSVSKAFSISWEGPVTPGAFRINGNMLNDATGLKHSNIVIDRFTARWSPDPHDRDCVAWPTRSHHSEGVAHWWEKK